MRRVLAIVIALAAIVAIVLYLTRDDDGPATESRSSPQAAPAASTTAAKRSAKLPAPAPDEDVPPALPPPDYKSAERPEVKPLTQEAFVERRAKGLAMLDDTIARVQKEHADAVAAKDTDRATFTQVRLDRLAAVRKQRADELEQARRGELKPDPDALPAGRRPAP
jgi:hypothetical protein